MKILMAQINPTVGDLSGNADKIIKIINIHNASDLIVFPELVLSGYPPLDLIGKNCFYEDQMVQFNRIVDASLYTKAGVVIGYFRKNETGHGKPFFNSLALIYAGKVEYIHDKTALPVYNIFDESRFFEAGKTVSVYEFMGVKLGLLVCEEIWADKSMPEGRLYKISPIAECVKLGVDLIISINASPSNVGKPEYRLEKFGKISKDYNIPLVYVNQVGGNDDILFDGTSFAINPTGIDNVILESFEEQLGQIVFDNTAKKLSPVFSPHNISHLNAKAAAKKRPESYFYYRQIVLGIRDYVRKTGFKKVAVSCSGGIDSALVLTLAVDAVGAENCVAITQPSAISSTGSVTDSEKLCENLGVKLYTYPIIEPFNALIDGFEKNILKGTEIKSLTKENFQARIRGMLLLTFCNQYGEFLPLGCGNKSELSTGYCTLAGDMASGLSVIGDLYKTEVWELAKFINEMKWAEIIPNSIIDKEPSAELYPGQLDTNSLPPYDVLDSVLIPYIEQDEINPEVLKKCQDVIQKSGFTDFAKIYKLVDRAEFKRRMSSPIIRCHQKAFGAGRRLPIAQCYSPTNVMA